MPLPRNAKMLSTKQPRAGKVGPAAENVNPEKVSSELGKECVGFLWESWLLIFLMASITGGELSSQEVTFLTTGWAQEEVCIWGHHQCEFCVGRFLGASYEPQPWQWGWVSSPAWRTGGVSCFFSRRRVLCIPLYTPF